MIQATRRPAPDSFDHLRTWSGLVDRRGSGSGLCPHDCSSCRCPIPGNIQGQVGWGSEQPDLVEDVPAYSKGVGLTVF